ncbi:MAG: putative collagen-binding domain-containing protein [Acidobacteriota bacterium]
MKAWWFNPRQNSSQLIGTFKKSANRTFQPPGSGRNNDWLLVIAAAGLELPRPGSSHQHLTPTTGE